MKKAKTPFPGMPFPLIAMLLIAHSSQGATLTLDEAFQAALAKNETVRQSAQQVVRAQERVKQARGGILPHLSVNASHLIQPEPADPIAAEFSPGQQTTAVLTLTQPIFRGFREFAGIRQQKDLVVSQEALKNLATLRLYQDVSTAYINVLALEQDAKNLEEQSRIYERRVNELKTRTQRGESSLTELLSVQSTQVAVAAEIRLNQGQLEAAREHLYSLTGRPRASQLVDPALIPQTSPRKVGDYLSRMDKRPDIQSALAQVDVADEGVSIERGAHLPSIDAVGNYYLTRPGFLSQNKWDVQFLLSMPIFAGGEIQAQVNQARAVLSEAELELAKLRRLANEEIRSLYDSLVARIEHVTLWQKSVELSDKNVSTSQNDYRKGLVRSIDVQLALGEYRVAKRTYDQARFAAELEFLRLEVAAAMRPANLGASR